MKIQNLLFVFFLFCIIPSFSQSRLIVCSSERNPDNTISIYADSQISGEYTVKLTFTAFLGYTSNVFMSVDNTALISVYRGRKEIMKLTPQKSAGSYSVNYSYSYFPGAAMKKKPDSTFTYLLPGTEGASVRISHVGSIEERLGRKSSDGFSGIGFIYKPGDTICAARAGVVYNCTDDIKEGEKGITTFSSERNRVFIQQRDGTLAQYSILSPIHLLVLPGEEVLPGQPLAVFNKDSEKYVVLFSVCYLDEKKAMARTQETPVSSYQYIPTNFYLDETNKSNTPQLIKQYTAAHPKEVVGAELSKKEKKKLGI